MDNNHSPSNDEILSQIPIEENPRDDLFGGIANPEINSDIKDDLSKIRLAAAQEEADHTRQSHDLEREIKKLQLENEKLKLSNESQNIELRKKFANQNFNLVRTYLIVVAALLFITGVCNIIKIYDFNCNMYSLFHVQCTFSVSKILATGQFLSDSVLITLLTTTTINVIGIYLIVLHYLFKKNHSDTTKPDSPEEHATNDTQSK